MEELIVTKEELIEMFDTEELQDTNEGWLLNGLYVDIIAVHDTDPKYLNDVTNAQHYKLIEKER